MAAQKPVKKHKSALKRQRQAKKQTEINRSVKSLLKTLTKKVEQAIAAKNADTAQAALVKAMKAFDKAAASGVLHKRTASRKVSRLSTKVSRMGAA